MIKICEGINFLLNYIFTSFGYSGHRDGASSLFGLIQNKMFLVTAITFGSIASSLDNITQSYIGIEGKVYLGLLLLFLLEFTSGVYASVVKRREKFESNKLGRIVVKIFVYSLLLIILNNFKTSNLSFDVLGYNFDFFDWTYFVVLGILIMQLLISVLENLEDMGWTEAGTIVNIFKRKVSKLENDEKDKS